MEVEKMVKQDNLDKLCEAVLNDTALTTKALNEIGFTEEIEENRRNF